MSLADKTLTCRECGTEFIFTASEQEFYQSRGFENEPGRCPPCRAQRKERRMAEGGGSYGSGGSYGGGSSYGGGYGGGSYGRPIRQMFPATCAQCGVQTEVPFRPREDRPVYCSSCYEKVRPPR